MALMSALLETDGQMAVLVPGLQGTGLGPQPTLPQGGGGWPANPATASWPTVSPPPGVEW